MDKSTLFNFVKVERVNKSLKKIILKRTEERREMFKRRDWENVLSMFMNYNGLEILRVLLMMLTINLQLSKYSQL